MYGLIPDDSEKDSYKSRSNIYISMKNDKNQIIEILVPIDHSDLVLKLLRGDNLNSNNVEV